MKKRSNYFLHVCNKNLSIIVLIFVYDLFWFTAVAMLLISLSGDVLIPDAFQCLVKRD